jgi:beta-aspartyl-dipeptidase (metallo-type)
LLTLIEHGEIYTPEPRGRQTVLLVNDTICKLGEVDARAAAFALGEELEVIDASGCIVAPVAVQQKVEETSNRELHLVGEKA